MEDVKTSQACDTIELAFLLKSMGFQIKSFEFDKSEGTNNNTIEIDINCHKSGLKTKFILSQEKCTCPPKPAENNNSFWEIQGTSPTTAAKENIVKDSSCTILPEINKKTLNLAQSTLVKLLQHYKSDLTIESKLQTINDITMSPELLNGLDNKVNVSPTALLMKTSDSNKKCSSTPLHSNVDMIPLASGLQTLTAVPKINLENSEKGTSSELQPLHYFAENIVVPKSAERLSTILFPSPQFNQADNDRDIYIIESITKARKELDAALIHLKCNITRDISESSILMNTPQTVRNSQCSVQTSASHPKRRASIGNVEAIRNDVKAIEQMQFLKPQPKKLYSNDQVGVNNKITKLVNINKNKTGHPDTPRPPVDLKLTVEKGIAKSKILRSATSTSLKPAISTKPSFTKQKSALPIKK